MSVADASRFFKEVFKEHYDSFFSPSIRLTLDIDYEGGLKDLEIQGFKLALSNAGAKKVSISGKK